MKPYLIFSIKDIEKEFPNFDKKALVYWQKKGYVTKLKSKFYIFTETKSSELFLFYVSNKVYSPSYISLASALSFYNVIPEGVYTITSVTTLKTNNFTTSMGQVQYRHVKPSLYFGYQLIDFQNKKIRIATIEKTILDYIYLHTKLNHEEDFIALRWNKDILTQIDFNLFENYQQIINSSALNKRIKIFKKYLYA